MIEKIEEEDERNSATDQASEKTPNESSKNEGGK
jgi:hypothetical protein